MRMRTEDMEAQARALLRQYRKGGQLLFSQLEALVVMEESARGRAEGEEEMQRKQIEDQCAAPVLQHRRAAHVRGQGVADGSAASLDATPNDSVTLRGGNAATAPPTKAGPDRLQPTPTDSSRLQPTPPDAGHSPARQAAALASDGATEAAEAVPTAVLRGPEIPHSPAADSGAALSRAALQAVVDAEGEGREQMSRGCLAVLDALAGLWRVGPEECRARDRVRQLEQQQWTGALSSWRCRPAPPRPPQHMPWMPVGRRFVAPDAARAPELPPPAKKVASVSARLYPGHYRTPIPKPPEPPPLKGRALEALRARRGSGGAPALSATMVERLQEVYGVPLRSGRAKAADRQGVAGPLEPVPHRPAPNLPLALPRLQDPRASPDMARATPSRTAPATAPYQLKALRRADREAANWGPRPRPMFQRTHPV